MTIPGRVLIVDNVEADVDSLVAELMKKGENVLFTGPIFESEDIFRNVRLVIFDYYLIEEDLDESLNTISLFVNSIFKKTKFFLIAIWSGKIGKKNGGNIVRSIKDNYKRNYKVDMPGILLPPFSKRDLSSNALIDRLVQSISRNPDMEILYEIESILDNARDTAVSDVYEIGNWSSLVKNLEKAGVEVTSRGIIRIYVNVIKRHLGITKKLKECVRKMAQASSDIDVEKFGRIFFLQNYYHVPEPEALWTGDVLKNDETNEYVMVLTPECDFAQDKYNAIKVGECVRIDHDNLLDTEAVTPIIEEFGLNSQKAAINAVFKETSQLGRNYYPLAFLLEKPGKDFFHLIIDFDKTKYLPKSKSLSELNGYSRICRVDNPLINKVQQRYGSYCSRVGAMAIPADLVTKLKKDCE